jgi:hypothetical protein
MLTCDTALCTTHTDTLSTTRLTPSTRYEYITNAMRQTNLRDRLIEIHHVHAIYQHK